MGEGWVHAPASLTDELGEPVDRQHPQLVDLGGAFRIRRVKIVVPEAQFGKNKTKKNDKAPIWTPQSAESTPISTEYRTA